MKESFPCPRCNRNLRRSGEVLAESVALGVFQCDECMDHWEVEGERFPTAFTFAVDEAGRVLDAATLEPLT